MDGPGEHYAKWNKSVRERQVPHDLMRMWNLMNKLKTDKQNRDRLTEAGWQLWGGGIEPVDADHSVGTAREGA